LLVIGIAERRPLSLALTAFAFVTYAHFVPTLLPWVPPPGISWIGHFMGFTGGVIAALGMFREDHKQETAKCSAYSSHTRLGAHARQSIEPQPPSLSSWPRR